MSERGYDSDAQCIGSPRNLVLLSPGSGREFSPIGNGYARTELSDLSERSTEWIAEGYNGVTGRTVVGGSLPSEKECVGWSGDSGGSKNSENDELIRNPDSGTDSTSKSSSGDIIRIENTVDQPLVTGEAQASMTPTEKQDEGQKNTLELLQSRPVCVDEVNDHCLPVIDEPNAVQEDNLVEVTGSEPSNLAPTLIPEILVTKRRRAQPNRSVSDARSIHLGDMNIHRMLASPSFLSTSITSRMLSENPSTEDGKEEDIPGIRSISESSGTKILQQINHNQKQSTSFYSPESSVSSNSPSVEPSAKTWGYSGIEKYLTKLERQTAGIRIPRRATPRGADSKESGDSSPNRNRASAVEALKSRFIEKLENDSSSPDITTSPVQIDENRMPRKVSVGWMSGGRRLGYGYTMVPPDKEKMGSRTNLNSEWAETDNRSRSGISSKLNGSSTSINLIPNMINRLGDRNWSGATAFFRDASGKDTPDKETLPAPLWARVASRMKPQNNSTIIPRPMPGHWPVFGSEHGSDKEPLQPRKQTPVLDSKDGDFLKRTMTRIYSTSSLQVRRRAGMENTNGHHAVKERPTLKAPASILNRKGSGGFRALNINLNRRKRRKSLEDDVPIFQVKHCGWSREDMTGRRPEMGWGPGISASPSGSGCLSVVTSGSGLGVARDARNAGKSPSVPLEQVPSDDTNEDLASMYQDCLETIPGSVDEVVAR